MSYSRYEARSETTAKTRNSKDVVSRRGAKRIEHYAAPKFAVLSDELISEIDVEFVYYSVETKFYKLAAEHYGDPRLWWVIAFFNKKPTDFHAKLGDVINIPVQWELVYNLLVENQQRYE